MKITRVTLAAGVLGILALPSAPARADLIDPGFANVPMALTVEGHEAFAGASVLVFGCIAEGHHFAFAKPREALTCKVKAAPSVYVVAAKDRKPFDELFQKNSGWSTEVTEGQKLLEKQKAKSCGEIKEKTYVEQAKGITQVNATYVIEKAATGCSLKQVSSTNTIVPVVASATASASASAAPSASASASPASSGSASPAAPKKSGCSAAGAAPPLAPLAFLGAWALALRAVARRRAVSRARPTPRG